MIHIFCSRGSEGARDLVRWINANGGRAVRQRRPGFRTNRGDLVVNWGSENIRMPDGIRLLNGTLVHNKYHELERMAAANVPVPAHSRTPHRDWLVRRFGHHEANDLLANLRVGDYYTEYVQTEREFRIHVFGGGSIRAGLKTPRRPNPHPRFRSWQAGWHLDYGQACQSVLRQSVRETAKAAVQALGYSFGAVDIGIRSNGRPVVFEVNSAPGLEGNTTAVYGRKLISLAGS